MGMVVEACLSFFLDFQSPYSSQVPSSMVIVLVLRSSNKSVVNGQAGFGSNIN